MIDMDRMHAPVSTRQELGDEIQRLRVFRARRETEYKKLENPTPRETEETAEYTAFCDRQIADLEYQIKKGLYRR